MRLFVNLFLSLSLLATPLSALPGARQPQPPSQQALVDAILNGMTPAEKVGQLFVASFYGSSAVEGTDIYNLITEYHLGGVVLSSANDNITDTVQAPTQVLSLTNELQTAAVIASQAVRPIPTQPTQQGPAPYVPLLIAINHEGDGYPFTEIQSGVTALPNAMAIGATWDVSQAESIGRIAGTDLAALNINLLLGPSLDVLETPRPEGTDLGTRVFGGDPYWVGLMGEAYIRGVHFGSGGRVGTVAKHFPGHGGSDRRPEDELPTVRKSFTELQDFDLVPFFAVTGPGAGMGMADGLMSAHIRFQGFQGNIRLTTQPVSSDPQAFGQLLALPTIAAWRANGGVTMSDSLGVTSIKRFYDPSGLTFNVRRITREAFNAGNDILLLTDFGLNPRVDQTRNIIDTLSYFRQQYEVDLAFADKVDAAVARVLALKLRLYGGEFDPARATRPVEGLEVLNRDPEDVLAVAQAAAGLVSPALDELEARLPEPPAPTHRIVFFTDVRIGQQCSTCQRYPLLDERALEQAVLDLYGPNGSGQTRSSNLQSYSFEELAEYLARPTAPPVGDETPTPEPSPVANALAQADWIVFGMLNVTPGVPWSNVVSTFLSQEPELVRTKRVIVFAFNAPYYLDTTDLSKVTAFYALYSRGPAFVNTAARLLFRDFTPTGAPPVSLASVGYNLIEITRPDPNQIIELSWMKVGSEAEGTPGPTGLELGDAITVTTGVLLDHNGHQVPDQTPVTFQVFYEEEGLAEPFPALTFNGVAEVAIQLNRPGRLIISARSEPANTSSELRIQVLAGTPSFVTEVVPTPLPSDTPEPTDTPPPPTITPTVVVPPTATPPPPPDPDPIVDWRGFFILCLGLAAVIVSGYRLGTRDAAQTRQGLRVALVGAVGMLLGYNYVALTLPGAGAAFEQLGALAAPVWAVLGGLAGLAVGWMWFVQRPSMKRDEPRTGEPRTGDPRTGE